MDAQDHVNNCDLLDFSTIQNLVTMLMMQTQQSRVTAAPQCTNFTPTPIDMSGKYKEWGIEIQIEEDPSLLMISKQEIDIMKEVVQEVQSVLAKKLDESPKVSQCRTFIDQVNKQMQTSGGSGIIEKCQELMVMPNIRARLIKGTQFETQLSPIVTLGNEVIQIYNQILMADADNLRKFDPHRWNSQQAMTMIKQEVARIQQTIQIANNQKVCIDYLKQYNDSVYDELWKYAEQCQYTQVDHQLGDNLQAKIGELQSELNKNT